jgi:hypothetical protein
MAIELAPANQLAAFLIKAVAAKQRPRRPTGS